jgi:hypothetical protein
MKMSERAEIRYTNTHPSDFNALVDLYEALEWNSLELTVQQLEKMCRQSWHVEYAYDKERLVGTGRILSDGVITGVVCGLGIDPAYQRLIAKCDAHKVIAQLMCTESLEAYYERLGFRKFASGMTRKRST